MNPSAIWPALTALVEDAYPREACGWLAGADREGVDRVRACRPGTRDRFELADDELLALVAAGDGPHPPRALFHSHPDGPAALSPADRAGLAPGGVVLHPLPHLVIAVAGGRAHAATLYRWQDGAPVVAARWRRDPAWRPA